MPNHITASPNAINKVAVMGAGVMGAAIAAHIANAGIKVILMDMLAKDAGSDPIKDKSARSAIAIAAIERLLKTEPAPLMSAAAAKLITPANSDDDLAMLSECDWIIEAVVEKLDIKRDLYRKIAPHRKEGAVLSSNTSTIPLAQLMAEMPSAFAQNFMITHFFNPPRYMRLLEIVTSDQTKPDSLARITQFCDYQLGKSIVHCQDRPGFIANRLGVYWLQAAVVAALDLGLEIEEADAIFGKPMGIPKTGIFGLLDLVGLDLMPHVVASLAATLPKNDVFHRVNRPMPLVERMIAEGYTGRKGKGGFYRLNREQGKRKEAMDLKTGAYRAERKADIDVMTGSGRKLAALLDHPSKYGQYAWTVLGQTLTYALNLVGDATSRPEDIDEAMRLGYNWKFGPFELIDQLGSQYVADRLARDKIDLPPFLKLAAGRPFYRIQDGRRQILDQNGDYRELKRPDGVLLLEDIKRTSKPLLKNGSASVWDIGDGVVCFEFTSKMTSLDTEIMILLQKTIPLVQEKYKALVIYNEANQFSAGANLGLAVFAANIAAWSEIQNLVEIGQKTYMALKYAPFPVVAAPFGIAVGGGCEIVLHADAVQAHAETYIGLVEVGVGLVPGWGGCKEMLHRWFSHGKLPQGPMPVIGKVFEIISTATVSKSAENAKELLYLRPQDGITMNRYRLLADAKAKALSLAENYTPPVPPQFTLPGPSARTALSLAVDGFYRLGKATPHDRVVLAQLADILSGGETDMTEILDEEAVLALERVDFMKLVRNPASQARIDHMLETGKPLRN